MCLRCVYVHVPSVAVTSDPSICSSSTLATVATAVFCDAPDSSLRLSANKHLLTVDPAVMRKRQ